MTKMTVEFTKMHGCGNDYVFVNCFDGTLPDPEKLAVLMSRRRFSVGSDGLILICPSERADAKMRIFNADGSEGKMCGNGIRCVGKFLYDTGIARKKDLVVETLAGNRRLSLAIRGGTVDSVTVDMGRAEFSAEKIPVTGHGETVVDEPFAYGDTTYRLTCVSMGNPHAVMFCDGIDGINAEQIGAMIGNDASFPEGVNVGFVFIEEKNRIKMRVCERGSGETLACGTGACAAVAASVVKGICDAGKTVKAILPGGALDIVVGRDLDVTMTGEAKKIYDGVYEYECQNK